MSLYPVKTIFDSRISVINIDNDLYDSSHEIHFQNKSAYNFKRSLSPHSMKLCFRDFALFPVVRTCTHERFL